MPVQDFVEIPTTTTTMRFEVEPAINAFETLLLLTKGHNLPGVSGWVFDTLQAMTRAERSANELVVIGLHYAALPEPGWSSFPAYIDHLAALDPAALRDKMLTVYDSMPPLPGSGPLVTLAQALTSAEAYLAYLRQRFGADKIDPDLERRAYQYAADAPALQRVVVDHLRGMWQKHLSAEWERVRPMLEESVRAFRQVDLRGKPFLEAARLVTNQEMPPEKWEESFAAARRILFVPNAHIGPYIFKICVNEAAPVILFGARLPRGSALDVPDLSRTEAVVRLSALADDTRLRILRWIAEHGEQRSQEIIESLDLSQSAASRHLTQLTATGYLKERRCEGAKCYALNPERISETFQAVSNFLKLGERSRT